MTQQRLRPRPYTTGHVPDVTPPLSLVQQCDDVVVLRGAGELTQVAGRLATEAAAAMAEAPRGVVVDLSEAHGAADDAGLAPLMDLGTQARDWPGTAFAVTSPDARTRSALRRHPMNLFVHVTSRADRAILAVSEGPAVPRAAVTLEPQMRAARAARDLVSRTCLDWHIASAIPPACLVVSELVNNAVLHAGTRLEVTLARRDRWVRVAVRDGIGSRPRVREPDDVRLSGRGLRLVDKVASAWGHLPTGDGGKVVWAVLPLPTG